MDRLTVLGGGSPFTVGLIEALRAEPTLSPHELVLYGRREADLELVLRYAAGRLVPLGWEIAMSTELGEALIGARYVLHQIRYGGLEGRAEDERIAAELGAPADETLGPGGLNAALRMAPELRTVAATISKTAPHAWVLNLTNPLSVAVAILAEEGVTRCVGLCELPSSTARLVAELLGLPFEEIGWHYRGFNHRGFIVSVTRDGIDQLPFLLERLGNGNIGGIPAAVIAELRAIPTKYFGLIQGGRRPGFKRSEFVGALRDQIRRELQAAPRTPPTSIRRRNMDWYVESVVPTISALQGIRPTRLVVNLRCEDGLTRELHASLSSEGLVPEPLPNAPPRARAHLLRFEEHERRVVEAVIRPSHTTIESALEADPIVKRSVVSALADEIWKRAVASASRRSELPVFR